MKITPKIRTMKEIEHIVKGVQGSWVRRRNAKRRLIDWSNELVNKEIEIHRSKIRGMKASGAKDGHLRSMYADVALLEVMIL